MHLTSEVEGRNRCDRLMALAALFDSIVPLIFSIDTIYHNGDASDLVTS